MRTYEVHIEQKRDGKRFIDWFVEVEPALDDAGNYAGPNRTILSHGVIHKGKWGFSFSPDSPMEARMAGSDLEDEFRDEIDEAMRDQMAAVENDE